MIEIIVGFLLLFFAIFLFTAFYEIILIIGGMALAGYGLEKYKNNGKNPFTIAGFTIVVFGALMLFVDVDEPGHSEELAKQEAAELASEQKADEEKAEKAEKEEAEQEKVALEVEEDRKTEEVAKEKAEAEKLAKEKADLAAEEEKKAEEAKKLAQEEVEKEEIALSDKDCEDFDSHEEVTAFWYENEYSAGNDPHDLDENNNGVPCEVTQGELADLPGDTPNSQIYYDSCSAVRAAGAAPIRTGDPGYDSHLDRDGDGIACE